MQRRLLAGAFLAASWMVTPATPALAVFVPMVVAMWLPPVPTRRP